MSLLDRLRRPAPAATDYQLDDGSGVYQDRDTGRAVAGQVVNAPGGPFVAVQGRHTQTRDGSDDWQATPAPAGWQDRIVRAWRG